ncbi:LysR family transcriptional regulator [Cocleimonas flava]|uniref:LysR family transcriptional regulator n=1 Tax=Cocleimonas flava TaxID=634765 RepID=A0A4R1ENV3_9GAMM|nr:LysR family transcriptional regulator [Cocleimonas flava]TCJ82653.1 LysR family transcriptional regulator [Cocleimonas flava]
MDQLRAINYFIAVAETSSFTEAAKRFNVPASSLSRRIVDLEKSLSATLLQRTTRVVKLTEVGRDYYKQVKQLVEELELTNESVKSYHSEPMGKLRVSAAVDFGQRILLPLLNEFSEKYPKVILDVSLSDEVTTLNRDEIDIAIRSGYAPNERVVAIKLMDNNFYPVASPEYLKKAGMPKHPQELRAHSGLYYRTPNGPVPWLSYFDKQWQDVSAQVVAISNSGQWLLDKALNGEGIIMLPKWSTQELLDSNDLVELTFKQPINITQQMDLGVFLLYQKQRYTVPKVKVAVDFLVERITKNTVKVGG